MASPGTGAISSPSNMVTAPSGPGLASIAQSYRVAEPPPLHPATSPCRIRAPCSLDPPRAQYPPAAHPRAAEVGKGQEQLRARCRAGVWAKGPAAEWGVCSLPGISFAHWKRGWGSHRSPLCAHPAQGGEKGWLGPAPSFSPAPRGSQVRPGAATFPCARHRSTLPGLGSCPGPGHP